MMLDSAPDTGSARPSRYEVPQDDAHLLRLMEDWEWRIYGGFLYKIKAKSPTALDGDEDEAIVVPFVPNHAQRVLLSRLWTRNIVLKARQLGFSTLIEILALDFALFNDDQSVVVLAQDLIAAQNLFTDKVKFAYDNLPDAVRTVMPLKKQTQSQLTFAHNNSTIRVVTSARSGTIQFGHISEMGKIAATNPGKAKEITTGTLQAFTADGLHFIESTAEGSSGEFYTLAKRAESREQQGKTLSPQDWRFHFFPWWIDPDYRLDPAFVSITPEDHLYFDTVEGLMGCAIDLDQRAWYVAKRENDFADDPADMWREYPSTPEECWQSSNEGKYLHRVLARARKEGRIGDYPMVQHIPCNTFWDVGASDDTVIWVHQSIQGWDRWVNYREANLASYLEDIQWLESLGCLFDTHYLPHDAGNRVKGVESVSSAIHKLRQLRPHWKWMQVPQTREKNHSIQNLRLDFPTYQFHEPTTLPGIRHLENYSRNWNVRFQCWMDEPRHDEHSHAADALMQKSDGYHPAHREKTRSDTPQRRRPTGMTA